MFVLTYKHTSTRARRTALFSLHAGLHQVERFGWVEHYSIWKATSFNQLCVNLMHSHTTLSRISDPKPPQEGWSGCLNRLPTGAGRLTNGHGRWLMTPLKLAHGASTALARVWAVMASHTHTHTHLNTPTETVLQGAATYFLFHHLSFLKKKLTLCRFPALKR